MTLLSVRCVCILSVTPRRVRYFCRPGLGVYRDLQHVLELLHPANTTLPANTLRSLKIVNYWRRRVSSDVGYFRHGPTPVYQGTLALRGIAGKLASSIPARPNNVVSVNIGPASCTPMGKPSGDKPMGNDKAG